MEKYDVIIIGAACAGLSAGLYAGRRALKTLILSKDIGGQAAITAEIENYPGAGTVAGSVLMLKFKEQAEKVGAKIILDGVTKIEKAGNEFVVFTEKEQYGALSIILAFGLSHRQLNVPGEKELTGRGVAYCATCDGPLFRGKTVAVVGGGNSAFDAADYLGELCEKVYVLVRTDKFRADQVLIDSVKARKNVEIITNVQIKEIVGAKRVEKIILNSGSELVLQGVFIEAGYEPQTKFLGDLVQLDDRGQIVVDMEARTSEPGIFAAGDVTNVIFKQAVISAGEGAKAALSAARYVQGVRGGEEKPDWKRRAEIGKLENRRN